MCPKCTVETLTTTARCLYNCKDPGPGAERAMNTELSHYGMLGYINKITMSLMLYGYTIPIMVFGFLVEPIIFITQIYYGLTHIRQREGLYAAMTSIMCIVSGTLIVFGACHLLDGYVLRYVGPRWALSACSLVGVTSGYLAIKFNKAFCNMLQKRLDHNQTRAK